MSRVRIAALSGIPFYDAMEKAGMSSKLFLGLVKPNDMAAPVIAPDALRREFRSLNSVMLIFLYGLFITDNIYILDNK